MKGKKVDRKKDTEVFNHEIEMLMKKFLYEVYSQIRSRRINKTEFAALLNISPAYLSQLFHSKKPLTFKMLVKFQQALHIEFEIKTKQEI